MRSFRPGLRQGGQELLKHRIGQKHSRLGQGQALGGDSEQPSSREFARGQQEQFNRIRPMPAGEIGTQQG